MACKNWKIDDEAPKVQRVLKQSLGDRWEAGVDKVLEAAGKKIGDAANAIDRDRKILKHISTSKQVKDLADMVNASRNDTINLAREASRLFDFINENVSKEDGVLLTRALGGDLEEVPAHLKGAYDQFRKLIDTNADELVRIGALAEKDKIKNYLKRYYAQYLEERQKSSMAMSEVYKRKDLTLEQRQELGMLEDAGFVIANTMLEQKKQIGKFKLLKQIADALGKDEQLPGYVKVSDETLGKTGIYKWGALAGQYVPEDVMMELRRGGTVADAISWLDKSMLTDLVDHIKVNVTVKNPGTHLYNFGSNVSVAFLNGDMPALMEVMRMSKAERTKLWELAKSLGLGNELMEYEKLYDGIDASKGESGILKKIASNLYLSENSAAGKAARKVYSWEDEIFKVAGFYRRIKGKHLTPEAAQKAMKEAMADYVDYSTPLPPLIRRLDKNGLFPFIHYVWKSTPRVAEIILKNPLKYVALQVALYSMGASVFNDNEDDYVKPKWADEEGLLGMFQFLPSNLFGAKQWVQMFGTDNFLNLGRGLPGARFTGLTMDLGFVGAAASLLQGRDPLYKSKLYKETDSKTTAVLKTLIKTSQNYLPAVSFGRYGQQWLSIAAGNPPKNHYGKDLSFSESAQRIAGLRKFDAEKEIRNSIADVIKQWKYDNIDTKEMKSRIADMRSYAAKHQIKVDAKKINSRLKAAMKAKPKMKKDVWYWVNQWTH